MLIRDFDIRPCTLRKEDPTWRTSPHADPAGVRSGILR